MKADVMAKVFGVEGGHEAVDIATGEDVLRMFLTVQPGQLVCPHCGGRQVVRKGKRWGKLQSVPFGLRPTFLVAEAPKLRCQACAATFEMAPPLPRPTAGSPIAWYRSRGGTPR